jgi:hypothetical protein
MHGIRTNANSLIITNEDYIKLFRPNDYRLHKLSLTINESTTLLMGYGVGDPNVLTALDWSKNVYQNNKTHYPNGIIQLVYNVNPSAIPIETDEGMVILETNSIIETIGFVNHKINENRQRYQASLTEITAVRNHLINADDATIKAFITDDTNRKLYLNRISNDYRYIIESFLSFLAKVFDLCWERAKPRGAFYAYNEMIEIVLDTIIEISYEKMSPALFETIASNLDRSSYYIGTELGKSRAAYNLWHRRRGEIPEIMKKELCYYAQQYGSYRIERLFQ